MPILILFALPFIEIYLLYEVALVFGFVNLIFFLILKGMLGRMIMRQAGQSAQAMQSGKTDISKAAVLGMSGLLISLPALLTNALGVLILFPPTRWLLFKIFKNLFKNLSQRPNFQTFHFGAGVPPHMHRPEESPFRQNFSQERDVTPLVIDVRPIQKSDKKHE